MVEIKHENLPARLLELPQSPKSLFVDGELANFHDFKYLTVIGSRKHTGYGREVCETLVSSLSGLPVVIVSGLAIGIDTIAHESALRAGIKTVAVPGSGLSEKVLYPACNRNLARKIVSSGGALVSEFPPDTRAAPYTFPTRNRIMAGLADAILVIEAEERSGTLITARMALDYNKDVLSVPGSIFSLTSRGCNRLIRDGATPITEIKDIFSALGFETKSTTTPTFDLSDEEQLVFEFLGEPRARDELLCLSKMSAEDLGSILTIMEIKGLVREELGKLIRVT